MMKKEKRSHGVKLLIRAVVKDPDGKVISDTGRKPSKSFVIQFLEFIRYLFDGTAGNPRATTTDGAEEEFYDDDHPVNEHLMIGAPINDSTWGIVVGTGDTAETNTDYKLATQLGEGIGAGQITHGAQIIGVVGVVGANVDLETKRAFTNNTGSTITVKEAGMYTRYYAAGAPAPAGWKHCIIRDVLALSVNVPDKCGLTIYYTLRTTV